MRTIKITWTDSTTPEVTNHKIYRDDVLIGTVGIGIELFDDINADAGATYKYEIQAVSNVGESVDEVIYVNVDNITVSSEEYQIPTSIQLVLEENPDQVVVTWIDSVTSGVTDTKVFRDDVEIGTIPNGVETYVDDTIVDGNVYKYEVQAFGPDGTTTEEVQNVNVKSISVGSDVVADLYVSSTGTGDGSSSSNPMSVADAKLQIPNLSAGEVMAFEGGDTIYDNINISNLNGSSGNNIVFTSYGTGRAIFTNTKDITSWTDVGSNIWTSNPGGQAIEVFKNGITVYNASSDRDDLYTMNSVQSQTQFTSTDLILPYSLIGASVYLQTRQYAYYVRTITAHNQSTGQVTINSGPNQSMSSGNPFFVVNDVDLLEGQDDWVYRDSLISMYSVGQPTGIQATVGYNNGITLTSCSYLEFYNIELYGFGKDGIYASNSHHITVDGNEFNSCYEHGYNENESGVGAGSNTIVNNDVYNSRHRGILSRSPSDTVQHNIIDDVADLLKLTYQGIWNPAAIITYGDRTLVSDNRIDNMGYNGIVFTGQNVIIEKNYVKEYAQTLVDGGAIYTFNSDWADPGSAGSIIRKNTLIKSNLVQRDHSVFNIYTDDRIHDVIIEDNTTYGGKRGIFLHNNRNVTVQRNTVMRGMECGIGLSEDGAGGQGSVYGNIVRDNIIYSEDPMGGTSGVILSANKGAAIAISSNYATWDFATYSGNKYYTAGTNTPCFLRTTQEYFTSPTFYKEMSLAQWQAFSGEDLDSMEDIYQYNPYDTVSPSAEKMTNGSFDANVSDWSTANGSLTWNASAYGRLVPTTTGCYTVSNESRFSQTEGQYISVEFTLRADVETDMAFRLVSTDDNKGTRHSVRVTTEWETYKFFILAATTSTLMRPEFYTQSMVALDIDNVSIVTTDPINYDTTHSHLAYNETSIVKDIDLPVGTWYSLIGQEVTGTITVQPYSSIILVDYSIAPTAPKLVSATIENSNANQIDLVFDIPVTGTISGWSVSGTTSTDLFSISGSGTNWTGVISIEAQDGENITLDYDDTVGDFEDTANSLALESFTGFSVTNNIQDGAYGPELLTDPDFSEGSNYWNETSGVTYPAGCLMTVTSGSYEWCQQGSIPYTPGKTYELNVVLEGTDTRPVNFYDNSASTGGLTVANGQIVMDGTEQLFTVQWVANTNSSALFFQRGINTGDWTANVKSVSVKEVL